MIFLLFRNVLCNVASWNRAQFYFISHGAIKFNQSVSFVIQLGVNMVGYVEA